MPAFVFPVSGLLFTLMAFGVFFLFENANRFIPKWSSIKPIMAPVLLMIIGFYCMQFSKIVGHRDESHGYRNQKINNYHVYNNLDEDVVKNYVVLNCPLHEQFELMFYRGGTHYGMQLEEDMLDSLQQLGYRFAVFSNISNQPVTDYIKSDTAVVKLNDVLVRADY